ncbi:UNVERIFIED_CONTAM: hypothetical protein Slati_2491300 [Sesamum latifolium]|uniref:Reverse transcriptase zinc-binding domain-containing protein n=1 Tax=Sesamum latifolium TaxID=2727402 RepID=A0AAW2WED8_9LAMI
MSKAMIGWNGRFSRFLQPERCIRQGDPLSPYLFIFCAEALSLLMQKVENDGRLMRVAVAARAPRGIQDRLWGRVNGWNSKLLLQEGRGVLIKSVLQSLPMYAMPCIQFPEHHARRILLHRANGACYGDNLECESFPMSKVVYVRLCMDMLPTLDKLERHKLSINTACGTCGMQSESIKHVFLECRIVRQYWALSCLP